MSVNDVADYAARVRAALADLPAADMDALLEDLELHLAEVKAEGEGSLEERLGSPEDYARELRAAYRAGQEPGPKDEETNFSHLVRQANKRLTGSTWYQQIRGFLPSLRPAWWVLRAYFAVLIVTAALSPDYNLGPLPNLSTLHGIAQIVATGFAIWLSVRLGRRQRPFPQPARVVIVTANVLVAFIAVLILAHMGSFPYSVVTTNLTQMPNTVFADGAVTNIYPYTQDGKPLTNVLLYDQDGRPLGVQQGEPNTTYPMGADGKAITNAYPLTQRHQNGDPVAAPRVAFPPWPSASASPGASPSASASPSVSPTH